MANVFWLKFPVCVVTESEMCRWPMCKPFMRCPVCLVTDGRCVLAEVSRLFGDRSRRCGRCALAEVSRLFGDRVRGVSVADVWPLQQVSRVLGD